MHTVVKIGKIQEVKILCITGSVCQLIIILNKINNHLLCTIVTFQYALFNWNTAGRFSLSCLNGYSTNYKHTLTHQLNRLSLLSTSAPLHNYSTSWLHCIILCINIPQQISASRVIDQPNYPLLIEAYSFIQCTIPELDNE